MKKREKKLKIAKETLINLEEGKDVKAILGGAGGNASCTVFTTSTAGGSVEVCC